MVRAQATQPRAARGLLRVVASGAFDRQTRAAVVRDVFEEHEQEPAMVARVGSTLEPVHDLRFFNDAPPTDPFFRRVAARLVEMADGTVGGEPLDGGGGDAVEGELEVLVLRGLACVACILARSWDDVAAHGYLRLVELEPGRWQEHCALGLLYKTRGRFAEGLVANRCAAVLGGDRDDGVTWNTGICATGAGQAEIAQQVWGRLGLDVALGRFGLPEGEFAEVKVRLAGRPRAERGLVLGADEPGQQETVRVERLSPCHGVVRSALLHDLGIDYGDVVLFDGAPLTRHEAGNVDEPVFPPLATLVRAGYHVFAFTGTQAREGQIADLSARLPADAVLGVHTEKPISNGDDGWPGPELGRDHERIDRFFVSGKLCAPPDLPVGELLTSLDATVGAEGGVRVLVPDLCRAVGLGERSEVEARRKTNLVHRFTQI